MSIPIFTENFENNAMLKITISAMTVLLTATTLGFGQMPCERLNTMSLPNATITSAQAMPAGPYLPIGLPADAAQYAKVQLPAYCRVALVLTPSSDSHIEVELWMPTSAAWNGKYQAVGGGGWVGSFNFGGMLTALQQEYATSSTDRCFVRRGPSRESGRLCLPRCS